MRRLPAGVLRYALAILVVIGGPTAVVFTLGTPELALPSIWSEARARIDDGTYPAGYVVDIISVFLLLAWLASLGFLVMGVRRRDEDTVDEADVSTMDSIDDVSEAETEAEFASEAGEPWYRRGGPIFDEPFSDEHPRVVVPPDEMTPDDESQDSLWQQATMATDIDEPVRMLPPEPTAQDGVADAEIIGRPGTTGGTGSSAPDEPPMVVPVKAYYFTRAEDTLRSISAQFLQTPKRWEELRSLNSASPGVAASGPDSLLPVNTPLALPGDRLPWGKPDPVYLWTLAEKFLFTVWGREPTPEEVVPFWRGMNIGNQLKAGVPPFRPEHLAAPATVEPPTRTPPEAAPPEATHAAAPATTEPPTPEATQEPGPAPTEPPLPGEFVTPLPPFLRQSARVDTLNLIEAAMRHLRAVTVGQLREKPAVLAVRVGTYGFEVLLNRPAKAPDGWQTASGGYVLALPPGVTTEDLDGTAQGPTLCPALVPVGDTVEGPLLLNVEEIGCLIVSGPGALSVNLLNAVVGTLGSSPLAADIRIITVGLDPPAGLPGWERVHSTSFDSPQLEDLLSTAHTGSGASLDVLVVGPGNDLLIQRAGQVATTPGSRLALVGATSSVAARWPWHIHMDETANAVVHPIACTMTAAQAMAPAMSRLLSGAADPSLLAPPRF